MRFWSYINILSLDVAAGAMICCAFFARILEITLLSHALVSLGLTVWLIYTVDHLADAAKGEGMPSTARHRFHKQHTRSLVVLVILAGATITLEAFLIRRPILFAGLGLAILVVLYLVLQASLRFAKEFVGAILYTCGVLAAPYSLLPRSLSAGEIGLIALFGATAFINMLLFSWFDRMSDAQDCHFSFVTTFGDRTTRKLIQLAFLAVALSGTVLVFDDRKLAAPVAMILEMNVMLYLTYHFSSYFGVGDRYRRAGDSVFLFPVIYLLTV